MKKKLKLNGLRQGEFVHAKELKAGGEGRPHRRHRRCGDAGPNDLTEDYQPSLTLNQ